MRCLLVLALVAFVLGVETRALAQDALPAAAPEAPTTPVVAEADASAPDAPAPTEAVADTPPAAPAVHDPTLMIIGVSAASLGVVGFAVFGATSVVERGRLSDTCGPSCTAAQSASTDALGTTTTVFAGLALAGAVTSLIGIAVMGRPSEDEAEEREEEIPVAVAFSPTGVVVSGRF